MQQFTSFSLNALKHFGRRGEAREITAEIERFHSLEDSDLISKIMKDCGQKRSCNASLKSHFTFAAVILILRWLLSLLTLGSPGLTPWE